MSNPIVTKTSPGIKGYLTLGVIRLVGVLPLAASRRFGALIGWLAWLLKVESYRVTRENIDLCYSQMSGDEKARLVRHSMLETGKLAAEICVIRQRSFSWLQAHVIGVEGEALITDEIARGRGVILLAPHLGNWEVLSLTLPGYAPMTALYQPPKQAYLEPLIKKAREKTGATLVPTNRRGIAKLLASLRSGGITAVLPDQNPGEGFGEFSPFFGIPAYTMTTVHGFLQRADCAVVMGFVKRVNAGFQIHFIRPPEDIYSVEQVKSLAALNLGVESCIAHCPEQYQWEYKRFKKTPDGDVRYRR